MWPIQHSRERVAESIPCAVLQCSGRGVPSEPVSTNVPLTVLWRPDQKARASRQSHSVKLIKKIKTPETRRFEGFRYSYLRAANGLHAEGAVARIEGHHALLRASVRHT
jgi:hypothetical protein